MTLAGGPFRVMVCDDSAVIRGLIARNLETDSEIQVVSTVANGQMAVSALARYDIEVCILDIEMPIMDGLTALPLLIARKPDLKVIMASTLTRRNADISLQALAAGAADYLAKPSTAGAADFQRELATKVKGLAAARRRAAGLPMPATPIQPAAAVPPAPQAISARPMDRPSVPVEAPRAPAYVAAVGTIAPKRQVALRQLSGAEAFDIVAIGSSTGGPQALFALLAGLKGGIPQPILITQHMPPTFTSLLAEHIERASGLPTVEASEGLPLLGGHVYVAPGDFHMTVEERGGRKMIRLLKTPAENYCRPSVDPMLRSIVSLWGRKVLTVILTGMGQDGLRGGEAVVAAGGVVIAQDEATSVVWGMPGAVAGAGICSAVLPLPEIAGFVRRLTTKEVQ